MATIGFIGLGNMGGPMAANLVRAGDTVRGFDLVPAALEQAARAGIEVVSTPEDAVRNVDAVITMLPGGRHVLDLYEHAVLPAAAHGTLLIDCSTIEVETARQVHAMAEQRGMTALDAPVSGGTAGAAAGTLTFMVGGTAEALERATPILTAMGKRIVHCGAAGTGQAAKICNNLVLGASMIAVCEAFLLGEGLGISAQALFDVMSTSSAQCWSINTYCPVAGPVPASPANRDYAAGFSTQLMMKDLTLASEAASATHVSLPLSDHARELYRAFSEAGFGAQDFSGIINFLRTKES